MSVREIHVIDRTDRPENVLAEIASVASKVATIVDLSTGRADAVSVLSDEDEDGSRHWQWISGTDYADRIAYRSQDAYIQWIAEIGVQPILKDKSLKEWFVYNEEVSLWWFTKTATKGQLSSPYRWLFYAFALIDELIENGEIAHGAEWHFWVKDAATGEVYRQYLGERGQVVIHANEEVSPEADWKRLSRRIITPLLHVVNALKLHLETRKERREILRNSASRKSPVYLMVTEFSRSWRPISDEESFDDHVQIWDFYLGGLPWDLRKLGLDIRWLSPASSVGSYRRWKKEGAAAQDLPDASSLATLSPKKCAGILATHAQWCRAFDYLFVRKMAGRSLQYRGVDMSHWIVKDFADLCLGSGVSTLIKIEQYRQAAELARPNAVIYRDEMFRSGRQVSAGTAGRTRRIGIQHGIINREATVYRFHADEVVSEDLVKSCPVPDVFTTFGEFARELFEEWGGYPSDRVIPIGGARHDHLVRRLVSENGAAGTTLLRTRLGLPLDIPVVLLCTQRAADAGAWFDLTLKGVAASSGRVFVAVKTHHYHGGEEAIHEVARQNGFEDYHVFSADTYDLIAASDVVVGGASTIIIEACLLNRPAITITSNDSFQTYPYQSEGLGIAVAYDAAMETVLPTLLQDPHSQFTSAQVSRPILCTRHLWNHDAAAARRLAGVLRAPTVSD